MSRRPWRNLRCRLPSLGLRRDPGHAWLGDGQPVPGIELHRAIEPAGIEEQRVVDQQVLVDHEGERRIERERRYRTHDAPGGFLRRMRRGETPVAPPGD